MLLANNRVETIILASLSLGVEQDVAHSGVTVAHKVVHSKNRASIERSVFVVRVTSFFVRINEPVQKADNSVFDLDYAHTLGVEVEGHVIVTLDLHKLRVNSQ